jgi:hypothetical protein
MPSTERFARTSFTDAAKVPFPRTGDVVLALPALGVKLPISQFTMTYGLNAIPTAAAVVALGRDARTGDPSPVYGQTQQIKQMTRVTVTLTGSPGDYSTAGVAGGGKVQWPAAAGGHLLFVGYVSGMSYRRTQGSVSLVINLIQKLFDLTQSSAGAADVVPGSPNSLLMPAHVPGPGGDQSGDPSAKFVTTLKNDMSTDFSAGLLKCLVDLATTSNLQTHGGEGQPDSYCAGVVLPGSISDPGSNERALGALNANGDWRGINNLGGPDAPFTALYPFNIEESQKQHATTMIGNTIFQSLAGTNMWSMLIGSILPDFGMGIVPLSDRAYLVPVLPTLRSDGNTKKIEASELVDFSMTTASQRPLYAVGIIGTFSNGTLYDSPKKSCVGGFFAVDAPAGDPAANGMWMFRPAPRWMDDWVSTEPDAAGSGGSAVERLLSEESHDAVGGEPAAGGVKREPADEVQSWNDSMKNYAKMLYSANALRDRTGTITGKLRFDISPGSTIIVGSDGIGDVTAGVDSLPTDVVGFVARVTVTINSQNTSAATTYELTHIRTYEEDRFTVQDGRISMQQHPFFNETFKRAPLVSTLDI